MSILSPEMLRLVYACHAPTLPHSWRYLDQSLEFCLMSARVSDVVAMRASMSPPSFASEYSMCIETRITGRRLEPHRMIGGACDNVYSVSYFGVHLER